MPGSRQPMESPHLHREQTLTEHTTPHSTVNLTPNLESTAITVEAVFNNGLGFRVQIEPESSTLQLTHNGYSTKQNHALYGFTGTIRST